MRYSPLKLAAVLAQKPISFDIHRSSCCCHCRSVTFERHIRATPDMHASPRLRMVASMSVGRRGVLTRVCLFLSPIFAGEYVFIEFHPSWAGPVSPYRLSSAASLSLVYDIEAHQRESLKMSVIRRRLTQLCCNCALVIERQNVKHRIHLDC
jgi:hypothetical protein